MFTIKTIGPDRQVQGYEATRFSISDSRAEIMILEPGSGVYVDLSVIRPDGLNHIYVENSAGKTVESIHRGGVDLSSNLD